VTRGAAEVRAGVVVLRTVVVTTAGVCVDTEEPAGLEVVVVLGFATTFGLAPVVVRGAGSGEGSAPSAAAASTPAESSATAATGGRIPCLVDPHSAISIP